MIIGRAAGFLATQVNGCVLWLRADQGITLTSGLVSAWADLSGNGNGVAQANPTYQPTLVNNSIGGQPSVYCGVTTAVAMTGPLVISSPCTMFAVGQYAAIGNVEVMWFFLTGGESYFDSASFDTGQGFYWNGIQANLTIPLPGAPFINTGVVNGANSTYRHNGTFGSLTMTNNFAGGFCVGGIEAGATEGMGGYISELIFYNRVLTTNEQLMVWNYLSARYGISP